MEVELESERQQGAHEVGGHALGWQARPPPSWRGGGPPSLHLLQVFFIFSKKLLREVLGHSENFSFLHIKQHHGSSAENIISPG